MGEQHVQQGLLRLWAVVSTIWIFAVGALVRIDVSFSRWLDFMVGGLPAQPAPSSMTNEQWAILNRGALTNAPQVFFVDLLFMILPSLIVLIAIFGGLWAMKGFTGNRQ